MTHVSAARENDKARTNGRQVKFLDLDGVSFPLVCERQFNNLLAGVGKGFGTSQEINEYTGFCFVAAYLLSKIAFFIRSLSTFSPMTSF